MRKIDIYAEEHFGGDMQAALTHLYSGTDGASLDPYVDELTREEALFIFDIIHQDAKAHYGSEEVYRSELQKARLLDSIQMTVEEVRSADGNPFKKKVVTNLLLLLMGLPLAHVLLGLLGVSEELLGLLFSAATTLLAFRTAGSLRDHSRFKKVRKMLEADETP